MLRWGLSLVLGGGLACLAAIFIGARAAPSCDALSAEDQTYDVAVVLGATIGGADGQSFGSSLTRADAGVHLIEIDVVERLHMTGGRLRPEWPSAGERMAEHAVSLGVAAEQISTEDQSHSTLQNALFSGPQIRQSSTLLVTDGFHITRAWLSFAWAGVAPDAVCTSSRLRGSDGSLQIGAAVLAREVASYGFNLVRAAAYSALHLTGRDVEGIVWILE